MRRLLLAAAAWLAAAGICIAAQTPPAAKSEEPVVKSQATSVTATVEAIDRTARQVTLKTEDGRLVTSTVDDAVKRFDALQVGDRVTVTYYETMLLQVEKPGEPPFTTGTTGAITPAPGDKPGGTYARQVKAAATVEDITRDPPTMTVRGDQGRVLTFRVADTKLLDRVKKGDRIDVTYTEAYVVKVEPAAPK